ASRVASATSAATAPSRLASSEKCGERPSATQRCTMRQRVRTAAALLSLARLTAGHPACPGCGPGTRSLSLEEASPHRAGVVAAWTLAGKITGGELGLDLHPRVRRNHVVRQRHAFVDGDALADERVALHVAHRGEAMDAGDAEPMQHVRHQLLEAHIAHAGHAFGALEIAGGTTAAFLALARVVDEELGDRAERAAFLAVIDHEPDAARLRHLNGDLDAVREVRPAGADVGAEHVGAVALVVHAAGEG